MFLCLKRRLKRTNVLFWHFRQRIKHRNASGFGVFDSYDPHAWQVFVPRAVRQLVHMDDKQLQGTENALRVLPGEETSLTKVRGPRPERCDRIPTVNPAC